MKIIKKIKQKDIDIYLLIIGIIVLLNFNNILKIGDKLWNFANIYKMSIGYEIYNDLNVIITPLFFWIGKYLFTLLGANYKTFALYNVIISSSYIILIYKILKQLEIDKLRRIIYMLIILVGFKGIITQGANYNIAAFIPIFISIIMLLNKKSFYIQGILIFLTFMLKQNIGIYHAIGVMLYIIIINKNTKQSIKDILKVVISCSILMSLFITTLYFKGILNEFVNYTMLGIKEFTRNSFFSYNSSLYFYLSILLDISMIVLVNSKKHIIKDRKVKENINILTIIRNTYVTSCNSNS